MKDQNQTRAHILLATATALACLGLALPAQAHEGASHAGLMAGVLHPLLGIDHLLLLIAVGTLAAATTPLLLVWALGGGLIGAILGGLGAQLPGLELLAALAISAVGLLALIGKRTLRQGLIPTGSLVALSVALHALLHGQAAPTDGSTALWWTGILITSSLLSPGAYLLLRRLPAGWTRQLALLLVVLGGLAALSF